MKQPEILLIYKRSALSVAGRLSQHLRFNDRFQSNHKTHAACVKQIEAILKSNNISYHKHARSRGIDYRPYGLIITVGGDGTLLEAARGLNNHQLLLGVNSDPSWSIGQFCCSNINTFEKTLLKTLEKKPSVQKLTKLSLKVKSNKNKQLSVECLNDILICHANPAAMTRYKISIGKISEYHRNSGIWFSTAAGSTGAMFSAGGELMPATSTDIQYKPRELYNVKGLKYHLSGGMIKKSNKAVVISSMPRGCVFVDGSHVKIPFSYGSCAEISSSENYIQLIHEATFH